LGKVSVMVLSERTSEQLDKEYIESLLREVIAGMIWD
jgi:hypothetical protein